MMSNLSNFNFLVPFLALVTLLIVLVLAMVSQAKTIERMNDPRARKSTLAQDAPNTTPDHRPVE